MLQLRGKRSMQHRVHFALKKLRARLRRPKTWTLIGSALQSLASIATVAAVFVAANQFLAGEKMVRERQRGMATAAADICSASASVMMSVAKMGGDDGIMISLAGMQRAHEAQLNDLPLSEMPTATAMQALSGCRHTANWYSSLKGASQGNRMAMCLNAQQMEQHAEALRAEARHPNNRFVYRQLPKGQKMFDLCHEIMDDL